MFFIKLTEFRIDFPDFSEKLCSMEAKCVAFEQEMLLRFDYGFAKGTPTLVLLQATFLRNRKKIEKIAKIPKKSKKSQRKHVNPRDPKEIQKIPKDIPKIQKTQTKSQINL